jgi:hypothetical protein
MSTDLRAIMDRDDRRRRMINDPDLVGDTLLFALAMQELIAARKEHRRSLRSWVDEVAELAWGRAPGDAGRFRVQRVIDGDIPRFEPAREHGQTTCVAPMIRRTGLCGKSASTSMVDHDPITGDARWIGLCSRHKDLRAKFDARRREWITNGKPSPPPNRGGVLKRYFKADWTEVYRWAAPWRTPLDGAVEPTPPRPKLRLVRDDSSAGSTS